MREHIKVWGFRPLLVTQRRQFYRHFVVCLVLLVAATGFTRSALGQGIPKAARDATEQMLQAIATDIRKHYYDPALHGLDWEARVADAKKNIENSSSYDIALAKIAEAIDSLNDSHTFMLPPGIFVTVTDGSMQWWEIVASSRGFDREATPRQKGCIRVTRSFRSVAIFQTGPRFGKHSTCLTCCAPSRN